MQATQSTNAEGKRAFPSPFTAPIQAARRLMERQPKDGEQAESLSESAVPAREPASSGTGVWRGQLRYEEAEIIANLDASFDASLDASLDAGLEYAESGGNGLGDKFGNKFEDKIEDELKNEFDPGLLHRNSGSTAAGRTDQPFGRPPFVSLGLNVREDSRPDLSWERGPDPAAVRAAISRLARESQDREFQARESRARELRSKEAAAPRDAAAFADAVTFEDVARRVWGEVEREGTSKFDENLSQAGAASTELAALPSEGISCATPAATSTPANASVVDSALPDGLRSSGNPAFADLPAGSPVGSTSGPETGTTAATEAAFPSLPDAIGLDRDLSRGPNRDASRDLAEDTLPAGLAPSTEEGECLAHDAGNLLSAMRLYSELLCISGVLQERHRHYADDLKLLAMRSQKLIDRLLKLGERLSQARAEAEAEADIEAPLPGHLQASIEQGREDAPADAAAQRSPNARIGFKEPEPTHGTIVPRQETAFSPARQVAGSKEAGPKEVGPQEASPQETNVVAVLQRIGNLLQTLSRGALRIDLGSNSAPTVAIGLEPLERILVNLVTNATAAVQANGGAIRIRTRVENAEGTTSAEDQNRVLVLTVDDSGVGMNAAQLEEVLGQQDRESQTMPEASTGPEARGRRGLGLRIVRELVASSGGRLSIQSQPGIGTRVEIRWPARLPAAGSQQPEGSERPATTFEGFHSASIRKPVGVARSTDVGVAVARIRAGSLAEREGGIAC